MVQESFFLKKGTFNALSITEANFSDAFRGFLILLAQYFWTSVLLDDPADDEDCKSLRAAACQNPL
jgi:hypothetical protein